MLKISLFGGIVVSMKKMNIFFVCVFACLLSSCGTTSKAAPDEVNRSGGVGYFFSGTYDSTHQRILDWAEYYGLEIASENKEENSITFKGVSFEFGENRYWTDIEISYPEKNNKQLYVECTNALIGDEKREPTDDEYFEFRVTLDLFLQGMRTGEFVFSKSRELPVPDYDFETQEEVLQE